MYMTYEPYWFVRRRVTGCFGWGSVRRTAVCCWHHQEARLCTCLPPTRSCAPWAALPGVTGYAPPRYSRPPPFPLPPHASHVILPLTPATHLLSTHHTAHLHVMPFLDWPPPGETFGSLVQESDDRLTMHILHGTSCQCSIPVCWHQECHDHVCVLTGHGTCKE